MSQISLSESGPRHGEANPLISVKDLTVCFSKSRGLFRRETTTIRAVDGISFELRESEVLSVVGESGSGKTTLARCIMHLQSTTGGSILWRGKNVNDLHGRELREYRKNVQMIYQDPFESLNHRQNVLTTISIPLIALLSIRDKDQLKTEASDLLNEVGLDPKKVLHRLPHQLSGGERQRVNIARALASRPKLLVADEPVTMVDASQRLSILSLLMKLKNERNLSILFITHDLASANMVSDRTAIMYLGKMFEIGPSSSVLSTPDHPYTKMILDATPSLDSIPKFEDFAATIEESELVSKGCVFWPRCRYATQVCKEMEPPLSMMSDEHATACHHPLTRSV